VTVFQILLLGLYVPLTCLLAIYGFYRARMVLVYFRVRRQDPRPPAGHPPHPTVLIQIPVFNERHVVARILEATARLDYPRDRYRVQLLDDSTDETVTIAARACDRLRAEGVQVEHIRRDNREGFKAGALAAGLLRDDSELVAIFDADFVPPPEFLKETVPYFARPEIGLVQTRWEHLNLEENLLTRVQSFFIDGHFILESTYRHRTGRFFNFNGTGGIWRRRCIDDAGGWSSDSIAEDTEISIRAYLKGWRFVFLRDLTVPAELPADVTAYKSQQHRWAKGYTEIFLQQAGRIWRSPELRLLQKLEAMLMLSNHLAFLLFAALTILHLPLVLVRSSFHAAPMLRFLDVLGINLILLAFFGFYVTSQWEARRFTLKRLAHVPLVLGLGMGLMVNSCRGVLEALFKVRTGFVRTPKENDRPDPAYKARAAILQAVVEVAFGAYLLFSCGLLVSRGQVWGAPLNLLVACGFVFLGVGTLRRHLPAAAPAPAPAPDAEPEPEPAAETA